MKHNSESEKAIRRLEWIRESIGDLIKTSEEMDKDRIINDILIACDLNDDEPEKPWLPPKEEKKMKYNDEIVWKQYEIRELVIINFIEWYASEEVDREPLRQAMQLYLQQELWIDFEGMKLKDTRKKGEWDE